MKTTLFVWKKFKMFQENFYEDVLIHHPFSYLQYMWLIWMRLRLLLTHWKLLRKQSPSEFHLAVVHLRLRMQSVAFTMQSPRNRDNLTLFLDGARRPLSRLLGFSRIHCAPPQKPDTCSFFQCKSDFRWFADVAHHTSTTILRYMAQNAVSLCFH